MVIFSPLTVILSKEYGGFSSVALRLNGYSSPREYVPSLYGTVFSAVMVLDFSGDGVLCFYIEPEKLRKQDFSDVRIMQIYS